MKFIVSCSSGINEHVSTYTVPRGDFKNVLNIDGVAEAVRSVTMTCPNYAYPKVEWIVEDGTYVEQGEVVCILKDFNLETQHDQLTNDLENAQANFIKMKAKLEMEYAMLEAEVKSNDAATKLAQLDSLQMEYASPRERRIKELNMAQVRIEKKKYENKLKALSVIQQSEVRKLEIQVQQLANQLSTVKGYMEGLTIKALQKGLALRSINYITGSKIQVDDQTFSNMPLVNIPEFTEMKVKMIATETNFKYITVGDSVNYTFDAMPDNVASGKISFKTPVGRPYKNGSAVKIFDIESTIDSVLTMPEPGFTVNCQVFLKEIKDTLFVPQIAVYDEDSMKVVYVKKPKGFEMREVEVGTSSIKEVIIAKGLEEGEEVALTKPKSSWIKEKTLFPKENPVDSTSNQEPDSVNIAPGVPPGDVALPK